MFKKLLKHLENRRKYNRFKRSLAERARSRCLVGLLLRSGALTTMRRARV